MNEEGPCNMNPLNEDFIVSKLVEAKVHFERALDCKHTEFDDLYPYMLEHPQFFWYKRYVAWSELLTLVKLADEVGIAWAPLFSIKQAEYIEQRVMSSRVLDEWFEINELKEHV